MPIEIPAFLAEQNERASGRGLALSRLLLEGRRQRLAEEQAQQAHLRGSSQAAMEAERLQLAAKQFEVQQPLWAAQQEGQRLNNLLATVKAEQGVAAQRKAVRAEAQIGAAMEFESSLDLANPREAMKQTAQFIAKHSDLAFSAWHENLQERISKAQAAKDWSERIVTQVSGRKSAAEVSAASRQAIEKLRGEDRMRLETLKAEGREQLEELKTGKREQLETLRSRGGRQTGPRKWRSEADEWSDAYARGFEVSDADASIESRNAEATKYANEYIVEWRKIRDTLNATETPVPGPNPASGTDVDWKGRVGGFRIGVPKP